MIFEDVFLQWSGDEYKIPATEIMRTIAKVESIISVSDLANGNRNRAPLTRIASAYSVALDCAGVKASEEDCYAALFNNQGAGIQAAIVGLLSLMIPPKKFQTLNAEPDTAKKKKSALMPFTTIFASGAGMVPSKKYGNTAF